MCVLHLWLSAMLLGKCSHCSFLWMGSELSTPEQGQWCYLSCCSSESVVINSSPQLAENLYPKLSFERLWGLWRCKEVGSSILLWCINKENFLFFCYHCSHPYYLRTWFAVYVVIFHIFELWQIFDICSFLVVRGDMLAEMVFMYQNWCSCVLACVLTLFEAGVHTKCNSSLIQND